MRLGEKLRYLREVEGTLRGMDRELSQVEMARLIQKELGKSISQSYLSQIESGARPHLTNSSRMLLARFFKVHPGYLVDDPEGFHTELLSDNAIPLIEAGVINGQRKNFKPRKIILGFVLGSKQLFDFVDENPIFEFHPSAYTNDPFRISLNERMVAINSAIEVDLTGQVCAESIGSWFYSGFGGQLDFIRGAARSKWGKPIIALPSTAKDGAVSRIVPRLAHGAGVLTGRADVHYVVTEYGVAYLHGRTIRQRADALIQIAHPKFRIQLAEYCEKQRWFQRNELENGQVRGEHGITTAG